MLRRKLVPATLVALIALGSGLSGAGAATLSQVDLQDDSAQGLAHMILTFESEVPDLEVRKQPGGMTVWLADTTAQTEGTERVSVVGKDGGTEVRLDWPGIDLRAVHVKDRTVTVRVGGGPLGGSPGAGYRLGVGDVVTVSVYRDPELSGDFPVSSDGTILMPLVGAVPAAGRSEAELIASLRKLLGEYLVDPQFSVSVKTYQSQYVVVAQPGGRAHRVALRPGMTLRDVISEAGVPLSGSQEVTLTREGDAGAPITLNAADLDAAGAPAPRDGDVMTVQEPDFIFVSGEVRRPGKFAYSTGMTLQQALILAEGLTEWASKKEIRIQRRVGERTTDEVVNLKRVQERKIPDPVLRPGDLILVRRRLM
jgi:polysaccharide export outer membrane protein